MCNPVNEMNLVPSLLQAIVNVDGDALVMHAGDKPYVVAPAGQVELASRGLTLEAVNGIVTNCCRWNCSRRSTNSARSSTSCRQGRIPGEHFTVVAARGGDDVWAEIRRRRVPDEDQIPEDFFPPRAASAAAAPMPPPQPVPAAPPPPMAVEHHETFEYRQTVVHEDAGYQGAVARQETTIYQEPLSTTRPLHTPTLSDTPKPSHIRKPRVRKRPSPRRKGRRSGRMSTTT